MLVSGEGRFDKIGRWCVFFSQEGVTKGAFFLRTVNLWDEMMCRQLSFSSSWRKRILWRLARKSNHPKQVIKTLVGGETCSRWITLLTLPGILPYLIHYLAYSLVNILLHQLLHPVVWCDVYICTCIYRARCWHTTKSPPYQIDQLRGHPSSSTLKELAAAALRLGVEQVSSQKSLVVWGCLGFTFYFNFLGGGFKHVFVFAHFSKLTNIFQMGWNHQLVYNIYMFIFIQQVSGDLAGPLSFSSAYLHKISPQKKKARTVPRVTSILMPLGLEIKSLSVAQVWLDELWFAAPKLRDNSLDIDSFSKQVEHRVGMVAEKTWFDGKMLEFVGLFRSAKEHVLSRKCLNRSPLLESFWKIKIQKLSNTPKTS